MDKHIAQTYANCEPYAIKLWFIAQAEEVEVENLAPRHVHKWGISTPTLNKYRDLVKQLDSQLRGCAATLDSVYREFSTAETKQVGKISPTQHTTLAAHSSRDDDNDNDGGNIFLSSLVANADETQLVAGLPTSVDQRTAAREPLIQQLLWNRSPSIVKATKDELRARAIRILNAFRSYYRRNPNSNCFFDGMVEYPDMYYTLTAAGYNWCGDYLYQMGGKNPITNVYHIDLEDWAHRDVWEADIGPIVRGEVELPQE